MRFLLLLWVVMAASASITAAGAATVMVEGKKIAYTATGKGSGTLLLIHGWACNQSFWQAQVEEFSKEYRVVSLDLPGHGLSEAPAAFSIGLFARAVEAVRVAEKVERPVLVGHSLGALVAREHVRIYPGKAKGLVFLDGSIFQLPPDEAGRERWSEMIRTMAKGFGPGAEKAVRERAVSGFLSNLYADQTPRDLQMRVLIEVLKTPPAVSEGAFAAMADLRLWEEDEVGLPVLALRAGKRLPPGEESFLRKLFPKVEYLYMPGVSHFLHMEKAAQVDEKIVAFLRRNWK